MSIQRIEPGPRMAQAVVHNNTVYLAGQVADKTKGASVTEQTKEILEIIDDLLKQAGSDKSKLLSAVIWIKSFKDFAAMNAVWDAWIDKKNPPVRACVHSAELFDDRCLVEIKVTAAVEEKRSAPRRAARRSAAAVRAPARKAKKKARRKAKKK